MKKKRSKKRQMMKHDDAADKAYMDSMMKGRKAKRSKKR